VFLAVKATLSITRAVEQYGTLLVATLRLGGLSC
ncbi:hypothetical protein THOM_2530, partial [Trachipleistophora hominis]